jgi:hypothetical protein
MPPGLDGLGERIRESAGPRRPKRRLAPKKMNAARADPRPKPSTWSTYLGEAVLSADFRCRGVIDTTLYSRSLLSISSTRSSILSF